ncbi:rhodanese-like domain-containing protein [Desulfurobacterium sp.]
MDELLRSMDFDFWASGRHKISPEKFFELWKDGKAILLDVRDRRETELLSLSFGINIPVHEIPDRLDEIPKDKTVCLFCAGKIKASVVYFYLLNKGFDNVKILASTIEQFAGFIKPGFIKKLS